MMRLSLFLVLVSAAAWAQTSVGPEAGKEYVIGAGVGDAKAWDARHARDRADYLKRLRAAEECLHFGKQCPP